MSDGLHEKLMTQEYEIEHGIPVPPLRSGSGIGEKMPLGKMELGDSFLVPIHMSNGDARQLRNRLNGVVGYYSKKSGKRFAVRSVDGGVRVWRVEDRPVQRRR
jgi:hypothetical protein